MNCSFKKIETTDKEKNIFKCSMCGYTTQPTKVSDPSSIHKKCDAVKNTADEAMAQDIISLGIRYASERNKWAQAGKPYRTDARILEIFDNQCAPCENFNPEGEGKGSCGICGCRLLREGKMLNKLAWATTECPLTPPKWDAEVLPRPPRKTGLFSPAKEPELGQTELSPNIEPHGSPPERVIESPREGGCGCGR